jgi:transposase
VIEDAGGTGSADGGGDEIVIRTAALTIHVPPGASEDHIVRVLAAVSRSG